MKRISTLAITLMALLSLSAIAATAALAENPLFLPEPTAAKPLKFTGKSGTGALEGTKEGTKVECKKNKESGSFTSARSGTVSIDFEECEAEVGGSKSKCHSLGDSGTTILTGGTIRLIDQDANGKLMPAILIELTELLHLECGVGVLILVLGAVIGLITEINEKAIVEPAEGTSKEDKGTEMTVAFTKSKRGEQSSKKCALPKETCEGKEYLLKAKFTTEEELASEETTANITFAEEVGLMY
jgi:hypothetical protein